MRGPRLWSEKVHRVRNISDLPIRGVSLPTATIAFWDFRYYTFLINGWVISIWGSVFLVTRQAVADKERAISETASDSYGQMKDDISPAYPCPMGNH